MTTKTGKKEGRIDSTTEGEKRHRQQKESDEEKSNSGDSDFTQEEEAYQDFEEETQKRQKPRFSTGKRTLVIPKSRRSSTALRTSMQKNTISTKRTKNGSTTTVMTPKTKRKKRKSDSTTKGGKRQRRQESDDDIYTEESNEEKSNSCDSDYKQEGKEADQDKSCRNERQTRKPKNPPLRIAMTALYNRLLKKYGEATIKSCILGRLFQAVLQEAQGEGDRAAALKELANELLGQKCSLQAKICKLISLSVGGMQNIELPTEVMSDHSWTKYINELIKKRNDQESCDRIFFADPLCGVPDPTLYPSTSVESHYSVAMISYRHIYEEFWCTLGKAACAKDNGIALIRDCFDSVQTVFSACQADTRAAAIVAIYKLTIGIAESCQDQTKEKYLGFVENVCRAVFKKFRRDSNENIRADSFDFLRTLVILWPSFLKSTRSVHKLILALKDNKVCVRKSAILGLIALFSKMNQRSLKKIVNKYDYASVLVDRAFDRNAFIQENAMKSLFILSKSGLHIPDINRTNVLAISPDVTLGVRQEALHLLLSDIETANAVATDDKNKYLIGAVVTRVAQSLTQNRETPNFYLSDFIVRSLQASPKYRELLFEWSKMLEILRSLCLETEGKGKPSNVVERRVLLRLMACVAEVEALATIARHKKPVLSTFDLDLVQAKVPAEGTGKQRRLKRLAGDLIKGLPALLQDFQLRHSETDISYLPDFTALLKHLLILTPGHCGDPDVFELLSKLFSLSSSNRRALRNCVSTLTYLSIEEDNPRALDTLKKITATILRDKKKSNCQVGISLCNRGLAALSQHWYLKKLIGQGTVSDIFNEISDETENHLKSLVPKNKWNKSENDFPQSPNMVTDSLELLFTTTVWAFEEETCNTAVQARPKESQQKSLFYGMRDRLVKLLSMLFDGDAEDDSSITRERAFVVKSIRCHACRLVGDARALYADTWGKADSPFRDEESPLILAHDRFLKQVFRDGQDVQDYWLLKSLIVGLLGEMSTETSFYGARGALSFIAATRQTFFSFAARVLCNRNTDLFLKTSMDCLVECFNSWILSEPSERASVDVADRNREAKLDLLGEAAEYFASDCFGLGESAASLLPGQYIAFVSRGIDFSFSTEHSPSEGLSLSRLPFLEVLSRFMACVMSTEFSPEDATYILTKIGEHLSKQEKDAKEKGLDCDAQVISFRKVNSLVGSDDTDERHYYDLVTSDGSYQAAHSDNHSSDRKPAAKPQSRKRAPS